jgi:short-subunit dehydrogenase
MKKMVIIGATSGIGESLARLAIKEGYTVGGTGRRSKRLEQLKNELGDSFFYRKMDVTNLNNSSQQLHQLIQEMGGMDILVLNAGISNAPASSIVSMEQEIINVNIRGFVQLFGEAFQYFRKKGSGQIVGISSMASFFGSARNAPYAASKAFISTYMQGYRNRCNKSGIDITITDIKAGFIESEMTEGKKGIFWMANTKKAVQQILNDIEKKRAHTYVTRRWRLIAWLIRLTPRWILERV